MVVHTSNSTTQEVEEEIKSYPWLHSQLLANLG